MWRAAASSQTRPSIGSVVPPSAARAFTTPKQHASYERRLELLGHRASVSPHVRYINPFRHANSAQYRNGSIGLAVVIAVVGVGLHRPLPPHGRIVVLDGHQFGVEVIGLSADQRS
jgi:hypothetical protein